MSTLSNRESDEIYQRRCYGKLVKPKPARSAKVRKPIKVWASPYALDHLNGSGSAAIGPIKRYASDTPLILFDASKAAHEERKLTVRKGARKYARRFYQSSQAPHRAEKEYAFELGFVHGATAALRELHEDL